MTTKNHLRKKIRTALDDMSSAALRSKSQKIAARLRTMGVYSSARRILFFVSKKDEPDTRDLIKKALASGKKVFVPRVSLKGLEAVRIEDLDDLSVGAYGIDEPPRDFISSSSSLIDIVLVPGLAFDARGARLGRGKGHYDRFLANVPRRRIVGIVFDEFFFDKIPSFKHDMKSGIIVTDKRIVVTGSKKK
ncbi:MAG: 5-formyltetrahydrofolate cyclo-ligase [Endomicrobiia bacterium]|nr:5-formyltetrahydrofolate cyclo-ligase [Endomicrobiia bacterium]